MHIKNIACFFFNEWRVNDYGQTRDKILTLFDQLIKFVQLHIILALVLYDRLYDRGTRSRLYLSGAH